MTDTHYDDPPVAKFLFANKHMGWLWLPLRLWLGYAWIEASAHKLTDPAWVTTGTALQGFWQGAIKIDPKPVIAFDWYRNFIQFLLDTQAYTWFGKIIAYGELLIGIALVLGAFTGLAALAGGVMNWNYVMAGTASTNPMLFLVSIVLILAWKNAGVIGLDRVLLPMLGTPWKPNIVVELDNSGHKRV